jgi:hypothetical protein
MNLGDLPLCTFYRLSGLPCPICGGSHAFAALLHGDVLAAWQSNPGIVVLLAISAVHTGFLAREALSGCRLGTGEFWSRAWAGGGILLLAGWGLRLLG